MKTVIDIHSAGFKRYFANTSWLIGHRLISMIVALFVGIYVARYLGPERFGLLNYAISFVGLFTALANLGLDSIMVRELVKFPERKNELLGTAFWLKVGGAILMWLGIVCTISFTDNNIETIILIAIITSGVIFQAFNVIDLNFQAEVKSKFVVYVQLVQLAVSSIIKLILVWTSATLLWFAGVFLLDAAVRSVGLIVIYLKNTGKVWHWRWNWRIAKDLLKDSWPLILSTTATMIYMKIDQVMIKSMLGSKEVGYYAAAVQLSEAWFFVPMVITASLFPAIINAKKLSEKLYYSRLQQLYDLIVWIAVAIALPTTFLSPWIIKILYGKEYLPATSVLSISIWAGIFMFIGVTSSRWFIVENKINALLYRTVSGAITNIILNIILIPTFGINGAAIATLISYCAYGYLSMAIGKQSRINFLMATNAFNLLLSAKRLFHINKQGK